MPEPEPELDNYIKKKFYYMVDYRSGVLQSNGKCGLNIKEKVGKGSDSYRIPFGVLLSTRMYILPIIAFNFLLEIQNIFLLLC